MSGIIFVSGAAGNIGKEVVKKLIAKGARVRAGIHSAQKADDIKKLGAEVAFIDMNDIKSMQSAMEGVEKAFSLSPLVPNLAEQCANFVKAAKTAGVKYIVRSSGMTADFPDPITLGKWHRMAEKTVEDSDIPYTLLRPNVFMQNYINFAGHTINTQDAFYSCEGLGRISFIDVRDIASVAAEILVKSEHEGKAYDLTGPEAITNYQAANTLSQVTERTISYVDLPEDKIRQNMKNTGMPDFIIQALLELYAFIREGHASAISSAVEQITGSKPISFKQFVKDHLAFFKK